MRIRIKSNVQFLKTLFIFKSKINSAKRIKSLDFEELSLKSPWVEDSSIWTKILKIWQEYKRDLDIWRLLPKCQIMI